MISIYSKDSKIIKFLQIFFLYIFYVYLNIINSPEIYSAFLLVLIILITFFLLWNKSKRELISFLFIMLIIVILFSIYNIKNKYLFPINKISISMNNHDLNSQYNIFFIETNKTRNEFNLKQLCAVESAAFNNPNANIYIYSINASNFESLSIYNNIFYIKLIPEKVFNNTKLMYWWENKKGIILNATYSIQDMSDSLRLSLLWKYGGFYSDLDTITIRSLKNLLPFPGLGYITEFGKPMLANGILNFPKHHKLLEHIMDNLLMDYNPDFWGYNGPLLFIRSIKSYCKLDNFYDNLMINDETIYNSILIKNILRECDINIFPENYFYPYSWQNFKPLFEKDSKLNIKNFIETYSVHFYGKFSSQYPVNSGDNNLYEFFALRNCPNTYRLAKLYKKSF